MNQHAPPSAADRPAYPALKDGFNSATVAWIAGRLAAAEPRFDAGAFQARCAQGFDALSLMARVGHVARVMAQCLPRPPQAALQALVRSLGPAPPPTREPQGIAAFRAAPHLQCVAELGLEVPEAALDAMEWLTCHFSGEFAIRAFLARHPGLTHERMRRWCSHPDPRVRRLASEGSRPLLPWAARVPLLLEDLRLGVGLIDALAGDPDEVVRRSAANHLNDISRLDAALALEVARRWHERALPDCERTLRQAMRTLVKAGHPQALALFGFVPDAPVQLRRLVLDEPHVPIGGCLRLSFELAHAGPGPLVVCVDYAVTYASARGGARRKVFKGQVSELPPGRPASFSYARDFTPRSTRRLYPGEHAIEVLVNGRPLGRARFELRA